MITNISSASYHRRGAGFLIRGIFIPTWLYFLPERAMSRIRSAFLYLMIMLPFRRKSMPQYVGPKIVAIDRYSKQMTKHTSWQGVCIQLDKSQALMNRMEPELTSDTSNGMTQLMPLGATAGRDTGSEDERWNQLPWFPKPQPGQRTNGLVKSCGGVEYSRTTMLDTACPDVAEIIPGLLTTL